jgi:large subunit ribosomal protein L5
MTFLNYFYNKTTKYDLINKFNYNKTKNLPKLKKIILNFSCKNTQIKNLSASLLALELITLKKGNLTTTTKSNILLKIRKGNPVGCKVVLQNCKMFTFLERLICDIIPIIANIKKYKVADIRNKTSFSLKILNALNFKELEKSYNLFNELNNLDIVIVFESHLKKELIFILNSLKLIN